MPAAVIALELGKGDALTVTATHVVSAANPTPIDISTWTIAADLRENVHDQAVLLTLPATVVSGPAGTYTFGITHAQAVLFREYLYAVSIFRTDAGFERLMATGILTLDANARYGA